MSAYRGSGGGKTLYFDCYSGISGDMTLGACLNLGLAKEELISMLEGLRVPDYQLEINKVSRGGIIGTGVKVNLDKGEPVERHLSHILAIIESSKLPQPVKDNSSAVFNRLAEAEAAVHGTSIEKVHFHEVGAVDAIVDIVGAASALYLLGVDQVISSPLPLSRGEVQTAHGRLPLPAPATLELIARRNIPVQGSNAGFELVTPTGAALVAALANSFGPLPEFVLEKVGYGAGSHDPGYPNFLRLMLGSAGSMRPLYEEEVTIIESNLDDLSPEIFGYLMDQLFEAGALDVFFTPIQMKKNRPAVKVTVIATPALSRSLQGIIFKETTTLGQRVLTARKVMRLREMTTVQTEWGPIRVKYAPPAESDKAIDFSPEFEDCQKIARLSGHPLKEIYRIAEQLFKQGPENN